jgi:hypothetical protein
MASDVDPLAKLVVDEMGVNRELLANVLQDKVRLDPRRGTFGLLHGVRDALSARDLVLTALLAQEALHLLEQRHAEGLAPRDIEARMGMNGGTLRPILKRFADQGLIRKDDESGTYSIPGYALKDVARELNKEE